MCINNRSDRSQYGFTLVELIMFIVIVSTAIIGVLQVMNYTTRNSVDPQIRKQALSIAEATMEEISLAKFTYCDPVDPNAETGLNNCASVPEVMGPEPGNTRPYDNVNDYSQANGSASPFSSIQDLNGATVPGLGAYQQSIQVVQEALGNIPATESLHITVRVKYTTGNGSETLSLDGYRTRYAPGLVP